MKRILGFALALALILVPAIQAELRFTKVSATTTSTQTVIDASALTVVNDGASSIYVRIFWADEDTVDSVGTALTATASNAEIKIGESLEFHRDLNIKAIAIKSASTSTVRLFYW